MLIILAIGNKDFLISRWEFICVLVMISISIWRIDLYVLVRIWLDDFVVSLGWLLVLNWLIDDVLLPMMSILHRYLFTLVDYRPLWLHLTTRDHLPSILGVTGIRACLRQTWKLRNGNRMIKIDWWRCSQHGLTVVCICICWGAHCCIIVYHEVHTV